MKSKLEILSDATCIKYYYLKENLNSPCITPKWALKSMDEYGKELAIGFKGWVDNLSESDLHYHDIKEVRHTLTDAELFSKYIESLNK